MNLDENLDSVVADLQGKVDRCTRGKGFAPIAKLPPLAKTSYLVYGLVPLVIMFGLLVFRPRFVVHDLRNDQGEQIQVLSPKKVVISIVVSSVAVFVILHFFHVPQA